MVDKEQLEALIAQLEKISGDGGPCGAAGPEETCGKEGLPPETEGDQKETCGETAGEDMPALTDGVEKRTYTVCEIRKILNISRSAAYSLIHSGCFHTVQIGGRIRVSKKSFDEWLEPMH